MQKIAAVRFHQCPLFTRACTFYAFIFVHATQWIYDLNYVVVGSVIDIGNAIRLYCRHVVYRAICVHVNGLFLHITWLVSTLMFIQPPRNGISFLHCVAFMPFLVCTSVVFVSKREFYTLIIYAAREFLLKCNVCKWYSCSAFRNKEVNTDDSWLFVSGY